MTAPRSTSEPETPDLFRVEREYQYDPSGIDLGHTTATEKMLYEAISTAALEHYHRVGRPLCVLDVCSASGGSAQQVLRTVPCKLLVLVDNEAVMCEAAKRREWSVNSVEVHCADAVSWRSNHRFDLILMNSAYHHIDDDRKGAHLRNMHDHLAQDGRVLVGEHFLPAYAANDLTDYRRSVVLFYTARINTLKQSGDSERAVDVIRQTGRYCWERRYEYQVCLSVFRRDVETARLRISALKRVWPQENSLLPQDSGSFLVELTH